jgi:hypothetical protein
MALGVDNLTSVRFNPLIEHKRFEGMLKSLGKKEILELLSLFDTYELNGGVYPLYMWIVTKTLKINSSPIVRIFVPRPWLPAGN